MKCPIHKISAFFYLIPVLFLPSCTKNHPELISLTGNAQGTTYHIKFISGDTLSHWKAIDSVFNVIDESMSTYMENSLISRINRNDTTAFCDDNFIRVFNKSVEIAEMTGGLFDPTVLPLVNRLKFGPNPSAGSTTPTRRETDSILQFVGYKKVRIENGRVIKENPNIQLDFSGIAQGYTVDVISEYLQNHGINNYMVEVGGEVRTGGVNNRGEFWTIGIDDPMVKPGTRELKTTIHLKNRSLTTSGTYRKYRVVNGKKISHIINPLTGEGVYNGLLSVSVIAGDCTTADALATSLVVMGERKAREFFEKHPQFQGFLIFIEEESKEVRTFATDSVKQWTLSGAGKR